MAARRALVTLPEGVWNVLDNELKGKVGDNDSEVIRNIVVSYLTERGYLVKGKPSMKQQTETEVSIEQIAGEIDMHDNMIESLAELLEEKGHITMDEWDRKIKKKVQKSNRNNNQ